MKNEKKIKELHCMPFGRRSFGGRRRLPIDTKIKPVHGRTTVFSMSHACLASGLIGNDLSDEQVVNWGLLKGFADNKWDCSVERFLDDAKALGVDKERPFQGSVALKGAIIGWTCDNTVFSRSFDMELGVCPDMDLTLAILSRRVGDIFISTRDPDFKWETLFGSCFGVDEDLWAAPDLRSEPWNRFNW